MDCIAERLSVLEDVVSLKRKEVAALKDENAALLQRLRYAVQTNLKLEEKESSGRLNRVLPVTTRAEELARAVPVHKCRQEDARLSLEDKRQQYTKISNFHQLKAVASAAMVKYTKAAERIDEHFVASSLHETVRQLKRAVEKERQLCESLPSLAELQEGEAENCKMNESLQEELHMAQDYHKAAAAEIESLNRTLAAEKQALDIYMKEHRDKMHQLGGEMLDMKAALDTTEKQIIEHQKKKALLLKKISAQERVQQPTSFSRFKPASAFLMPHQPPPNQLRPPPSMYAPRPPSLPPAANAPTRPRPKAAAARKRKAHPSPSPPPLFSSAHHYQQRHSAFYRGGVSPSGAGGASGGVVPMQVDKLSPLDDFPYT
ncbi:unnamed protein product [Vitrella brassicaformis CCMP3155]|uniref:Uncharacterized protein n=2 Tax=Vitrella brassicaformis TaxID=1169539 RepID=A0A0G4GWZ9_VITBC|nr:unnamed protein product [Vitrella brassicaformis CCMP3155]|eukprot:CEM35575.1 unnamed protein product [Vitrella brassicaformis CCMP3155]